MNALIVDDERLARNELRRLLEPFSTITVVGEAANADEAEEQVSKLKPDLLFLDINMPGRDGMELLEALEPAPHVIFVTAYDEHAVKAFELNALDYLLKPIDPDRLAAAINKLAAIPKEGDQTRERLGPEDRIFLKDGEKCWFVALKDVRLLESEGNYVRVRFGDQKPLVLRSLNSLEKKLDPHVFFRANRKQMVNLAYVDQIEPWFSGGLNVTLNSGATVEVSRRQTLRFKELMSL
ncbi:MAG: response regulator transcription factor [Flavobacteriales bacterium]|nr:response regulator transcription factor [Flavobacteriales bacterium]